MIMVDIEVPVLGQVYDFELNEEKETKKLLEEIVEIIAEKEKKKVYKESEMLLYAYQSECILNAELTLKEQGIGNGVRLVLF